ncbi:hypothetical protein J7T55_004211 [Diaporthe amygdali]|uniref:uncharacterized protein n=1 Tax=Phomopsis amygdali TaxID=1214568 RepID=UPI0022FE88C0|nr:uncharacterized protein J7T55_004211 [Diaporthe amygdali]KAJ0103808.1 hypothetical protein J7T55_004211 [Diaporthe amygdali]
MYLETILAASGTQGNAGATLDVQLDEACKANHTRTDERSSCHGCLTRFASALAAARFPEPCDVTVSRWGCSHR